MNNKPEDIRQNLQSEIVKIISRRVESGDMDDKRAKQIASMVLEKLPEGISYNKLMEVIPKLDDHFFELSQAVVPVMIEYERKMKEIVEHKIHQLVKEGKLDTAQQVADKAIEFEKGLS